MGCDIRRRRRIKLRRVGIGYAGYLPNLSAPEVYAQSRVALHVPRRQYANGLSGVPTIRVFEVLACGVPLVCSPWADTEGLFREGCAETVHAAVQRAVSLTDGKKLTLFPIGIGSGADMAVLERFSPKRTPLRLQGLNFKAFFEWLSKSVARVSQSIPGETVPLDEKGIRGWADS